jgi:RNA polymerase sigma-70 factor (ECF subfamily)
MAEQSVVYADRLFPERRREKMNKEALTEKEILLKVLRGDRDAYQKIVVRYMQTAYYIALGFVHNQEDARDLSQDAFIRAFRKIKQFDPEKRFFPWFYKLLKNLCLDHIKRRQRCHEIPLDSVQVIKEEKEDRELKAVMWRGIEELPFEQREIIILRYFRQYSYEEIAEIMDKPLGTVMSSLFYAKKKLREILKKYLTVDGIGAKE